MRKYKKVLVANRGEIALRIIRALREMGISTVAVYSTADRNALYTKIADESFCIGLPDCRESYLDTYKILAVAEMTHSDAIHPGIGFLSEDDSFAELCKEADIDFIGPDSEIIYLMGNKLKAKKTARKCGIPTIEGSDVPITSLSECKKIAESTRYPILIKAACGGGGKGIRVVNTVEEIENNYNLCFAEASSSFNSSELIIEQYISNIKHVEVQIIGDQYGNIIHLGDRECTIQRLKQKVIEETRSEHISETIRERLYEDSIKLAKYIKYSGPGTVEFLVKPNGEYFFLEMNTRLQVEHTITELITSFDIVKEQIQISEGEKLSIEQSDVDFKGYAMQCRIVAEDVKGKFLPSFGTISEWHMPSGFGVRVDTGYTVGSIVTSYYDSLLAKICCHGKNKEEVVKKMLICLEEVKIEGVKTNIEFLKFLLKDKNIIEGLYYENYLDNSLQLYGNVKQ